VDKEAIVVAGKSRQVTITLNMNAQELGEVIVIGHKNGVLASTVSSSLRTQTPLLQLSQNIQVVTGRALTDQQVISTSDGLLRNVSGTIRSEHWGDLYANVNMRGSQVQAFRNGFNVVASF